LPVSRHVLAFAPHADDEVFGCGGTLALHVAAGAAITVIVLTDGAARAAEDAVEEIATREAESKAAAAHLGLSSPIFWRLPDRGLEYGEALIDRLQEAIEASEADLVYAPSLFEVHPDHRVTAMAALEAVRRLGGERRIAFYEVGAPGRPNTLIDITSVLEKKRAAMCCFVSQLQHQRYDEQIEALNRYRTYTLPREVEAVEAFELIESQSLQHGAALALLASEHRRRHELGIASHGALDLPLVSVIIRSSDRDTLGEALDSVAVQTYPHLEVVLVNALGAAHRPPPERCGRFAVRWVDRGQPLTRPQAANAGLSEARGEYLMFLDDDDWLDADHIAGLIELLRRSENATRAAYAGIRCVGSAADGQCFGEPFDPIRLLCGNYIPIHAVLFHRSLIDGDGCRFDERFAVYEDWDFWLQVAQKTPFLYREVVTANYRITSMSGFGVAASERSQREGKLQCHRKWRQRIGVDEWGEVLERAYGHGLLRKRILEQQSEIGQAQALVRAREDELAALRAAHDEALRQWQATRWTLADRSGLLAHREREVEQLRGEQGRLTHELAVLQRQLHETAVAVQQRDARLVMLEAELRSTIHAYEASTSWQITVPLRLARRFLRRLVARVRPVQPATRATPPIVQDEPAPASEKAPAANVAEEAADRSAQIAALAQPGPYFVPLDEECVELRDCAVKLIAFYLPQFHPIPENDAFWGKGFTEWTNVSKALPQFVGHEQPRYPGELGYYDLRLPEVLRRQVELARQYGIHGFCFHYYWFNGKRLLERPLQNFLSDPSLDFAFCLCWANENWTRRWDGQEQDILIAQNHSVEQDLAFIDDVIPLMREPRYLRLGGKPLLIVYRPALLPAAAQTAQLWRERCRSAGLGEIMLVMAQTFTELDPRPYGFDAAVEFPPHHVGRGEAALAKINDRCRFFSSDFRGGVIDYSDLLDRQDQLRWPEYPLIKTVFPGWDNTARRQQTATIFTGATPALYRAWLAECAHQARAHPLLGEALVFINAWNEWAEGAYLEPDRRYGYAYLAATRDVQRAHSRRCTLRIAATQTLERQADHAVVLHLFYPELWWEMISRLRILPFAFDLYLSLSPYIEERRVIEILSDFPRARLFQFPNRGRDVMPFLEILRRIAPLGYRTLCKLHSKKSPHRVDGDDWRRRHLDGLLAPRERVERIIAALTQGEIGIVCADGQIHRSDEYWGSNKTRVMALLAAAGVAQEGIELDFIAGTMFWARPEALAPLLRLPENLAYEPEKGQIDGTLAHALERFIAIAARAEGWRLCEVSELP